MRFVYFLVGLFILLCSPVSAVFATGEFQEDYDVQYSIAPSGITIVTQNVVLTNKMTNLYPQKYSIIIDSTHIKNVIAYDNGGVIRPNISQKDGKTEIILPFNEKIAGLGRALKFSLRYENTDIAQKNGSIWEVNIPGVAPDPDLASYFVSVAVPPTFGPNAYMSPQPASGTKWTKEQMIQGGISAAYGTTQSFDLTLSYYLENPTLGKKIMEVALPPDTAFQKVAIKSLKPVPSTVLTDADGNWLAQYELAPNERLTIDATLFINIYLAPRTDFVQEDPDRSLYTRSLKYWEVDSSQIQDLAKIYTTPHDIYQYVVKSLSYDYNRVNQSPIRKGAVQSLIAPTTAICMEFTDLFIALARAAGIPAREAVGYAYTTNAKLRPLSLATDVLHAWPEYYDVSRHVWIPVDPTWGNTTGGVNYFDKLDYNHIVFSHYGQSSDYPYPAGFYKKSGDSSKDVRVQFAESNVVPPARSLSISYVFPKTVTSGFTASGSILIDNTSQTLTQASDVTIQSTPIDVAITRQVPQLPPYGRYSIPVSFHVPQLFTKTEGMIVTTVADETKRYDFTIVPFLYTFTIPILVLFCVVCVVLAIYIRSVVWKNRK